MHNAITIARTLIQFPVAFVLKGLLKLFMFLQMFFRFSMVPQLKYITKVYGFAAAPPFQTSFDWSFWHSFTVGLRSVDWPTLFNCMLHIRIVVRSNRCGTSLTRGYPWRNPKLLPGERLANSWLAALAPHPGCSFCECEQSARAEASYPISDESIH